MRTRRGCGPGGFDRFKKITDCSKLPKSLSASGERHEWRVHDTRENFLRKPKLPRSRTPVVESSKPIETASTSDIKRSKSNIRIGWTALALVLGTLAYSHCGGEPIDRTGNDRYVPSGDGATQIFNGMIMPGVNVRTSPLVMDDENASNQCARLENKVELRGTPVMTDHEDASNGPWIGFDTEYLPEAIQKDCGYDADGVLWVSMRYTKSLPEQIQG